ncbi:MAG: 16S rRNA (adenine(1518)-N(6)/adenine(1519)-N(6))-dimethyltransferase RsmA [bacterium]
MMVTPKKRYGQHFLRDENTARKIIGYINHDYPAILEIGPGTGVLSKYLLEDLLLDPVFLEVDGESVDHLQSFYPAIAGRLIRADFLEFDLSTFRPGTDKFTIIGNFPYNISTQILFRVLEFRDRIPEVIGMFQKEVAMRIAAPPGSKTYGILSVLLQAYYHIDYLFTVNESVFFPPPKVKSAVIRLRRNDTAKLECDEALFFRVVKTAFNQRRKTLRNSLRSLADQELLEGLQLATLRPEQLPVEDFVRITAAITG